MGDGLGDPCLLVSSPVRYRRRGQHRRPCLSCPTHRGPPALQRCRVAQRSAPTAARSDHAVAVQQPPSANPPCSSKSCMHGLESAIARSWALQGQTRRTKTPDGMARGAAHDAGSITALPSALLKSISGQQLASQGAWRHSHSHWSCLRPHLRHSRSCTGSV